MNVPGLSGTWQQRLKEFGQRFYGSSYRGTYDQNISLLGKIRAGNYGVTQAAPKPAAPAQATPSLAEQLVSAAGQAPNVPLFSEVLPFNEAWGNYENLAQQEAEAQVNPFSQRSLRNQLQQYNLGLANTGAGRFGRAVGGRGDIWNQVEQERKANILDWVNQRKQGFQEGFYNPAEQAWLQGIQMGKTEDQLRQGLNIPTYDQLFGTSLGGGMNTIIPEPFNNDNILVLH